MATLTATFEETIENLLDQKKYNSVRDLLTVLQPPDLALLMEEMPDNSTVLLFRLLPKELAAEVFVEMDPEMQETLIRALSDAELKNMLTKLYMDDTVDLVEEMPANVVKRILTQADPVTRQLINEMLRYPPDSAGSVMTTEFVDLVPEMTAAEAIDHIRSTGVRKETINLGYVTDAKRQLMGVVTLRSIIMADTDTRIEDLMDPNYISVNTLEDQETVAQMLSRYDFTALPVVDKENRLVGIVTVDDAIDIIQEEATEDIAKMGAITPSDKPYLRLTVFEIWKSRIPWLLLLMLSATFTGMIITRFENALASCLVLTSFIPMLMDTGGNSGSQASVTIIRGLSLQELDFGDFLRVVWKEARVAVLCGATLSVVNFGRLMLIDKVSLGVALVICLALAVTVFIAKLVGCSLPLLAHKIGFDPAVMASPFITTIVDALSLLIYFLLAGMILNL